jgi:hypothetical protein
MKSAIVASKWGKRKRFINYFLAFFFVPVFFAAFFVERLAAFFAGRRFDAAERFAGLVFLVDFFVDFSRPF